MAMLNKYANIYDKEGNLIRSINKETGKLENYTMEELEELVDKLAADKDENGRIKDPQALNNVNMILMSYYNKYGNPHMEELLKKFKEKYPEKPTKEQAVEALQEMAKELEENGHEATIEEELNNPEDDIASQVESNLDEEYVDFEEVTPENDDIDV